MLKKFMEMFKKNNKGFTLVELMVVVVIIGALTAIAIPVYKNSQKTAIDNAVKANLKIIDSAIAVYNTEQVDPKQKIGTTGGIDGEAAQKVLTEEQAYIKEWPKGPNTITYSISGGSAISTHVFDDESEDEDEGLED